MIRLTDMAADEVRVAIAGSTVPVKGLRLTVEEGGCAGFKYAMGLVSDATPDDLVVEFAGIRIYLDLDSAQYLNGTTVDFVRDLEGDGFTFDNPNSRQRCSCSKSFC